MYMNPNGLDPEEKRGFIDLLRGQIQTTTPAAPSIQSPPYPSKPVFTTYVPMDVWVLRPGQEPPPGSVVVDNIIPGSGLGLAFRPTNSGAW